MKFSSTHRPLLLASLLLGALALAACAVGAPQAGGDHTFTVAHLNDTHGRHMPIEVRPGNATAQTGDPGREEQSYPRAGMLGGYAAIASAMNTMRARVGAQNVLLLHGGDAFGDDLLGNLTRGEATIRLMNAIGVQYMALGNHDFDYGKDRTAELQSVADFPMRGANVLDASGQPFLGEPVKVFQVGGVRVGVLSLGYHNTDQTGSKKNVAGLTFGSGIEAARQWVPRLRSRADVVLVLSHQGSKVDRVLAKSVPGIDIIVGAHSHDAISPPERDGKVWMVQALSDATALGELTLTVGPDRRLKNVQGRLHLLWTDEYPPLPAVAETITRLRAPYRDQLEAPLTTATHRIGRHYRSESPFDVLVGNIMREHTGADVSLLPGVGYGVSLDPGPVTREMLATLLPHPTKLATVVLTGALLKETLEQSARNQQPDQPLDRVGGLIQTSGMQWTVDLGQPAGQRIRDVRVAGAALEPARSYRVVTTESMLKGLHRYHSIGAGQDARVLDQSVTELVENAFRQRRSVAQPPLGNVTLIKASGA